MVWVHPNFGIRWAPHPPAPAAKTESRGVSSSSPKAGRGMEGEGCQAGMLPRVLLELTLRAIAPADTLATKFAIVGRSALTLEFPAARRLVFPSP